MICGFYETSTFLAYKKQWKTIRIKHFTNQENDGFLADKGFKSILVNRTLLSLHEGSFDITLTVPLGFG